MRTPEQKQEQEQEHEPKEGAMTLVRTPHRARRKVHELKADGKSVKCGAAPASGIWQEELIGPCTCARCAGTAKKGVRKTPVIVRYYSGHALRFVQGNIVQDGKFVRGNLPYYEVVEDGEATVFESVEAAMAAVEAHRIDEALFTIERAVRQKNAGQKDGMGLGELPISKNGASSKGGKR